MRIAKKGNGDRFIECPAALWSLFFKSWMADHSQPCPLIEGHHMFKTPKHYSAKVYDEPKEIQVNRATDVLVAHQIVL